MNFSIDSLAPAEPIFPVMLASRKAAWVTYHNIIGIVPKQWWLSKLAANGDGVVSRKSAHAANAVSEIIVPADHTSVHTHPAAVLEVRRIFSRTWPNSTAKRAWPACRQSGAASR